MGEERHPAKSRKTKDGERVTEWKKIEIICIGISLISVAGWQTYSSHKDVPKSDIINECANLQNMYRSSAECKGIFCILLRPRLPLDARESTISSKRYCYQCETIHVAGRASARIHTHSRMFICPISVP